MKHALSATPAVSVVAEIQGLYGPFTFPEKLLQKIWAQRGFDTIHATTSAGQRIHIEHPGKWNHLGGPDFKNARLRIGDTTFTGDIEVHLRETDWHAHQHASDPAYENVILHVVLFPPRNTTTPGANGKHIPVLTLLPLLHHDLEQYAADDAIEHLSAHPLSRSNKTLAALPPDELLATLAQHTEKRWRQKIHYARQRINRLGWDEACHHTALEILGYSRNRAPMLSIASQYPLKIWSRFSPDTIYAETTTWAAQATRPANHPRTRLHQYAEWVAARPDWPAVLSRESGSTEPLRISHTQPAGLKTRSPYSPSVAEWRRTAKAAALRKHIRAKICGDSLGGTRLDTLICDGLLPLLAAQNPASDTALYTTWRNWFTGDMPAQFAKQLRALDITGSRATPMHNGAAQGLLGYLLEAENA